MLEVDKLTSNPNYKTVSIKTEVYNLIKEKAKKNLRGISNQIEYDMRDIK